MEAIIQEAIKFEEGEEKDALIRLIAYNLKRAYLSFNRTSVDNDQIKDDLHKMSGGKLSVPEDYVFPSTQEILGKRRPALKSKDNSQRNKSIKLRQTRSSRSNYNQNRRRTN